MRRRIQSLIVLTLFSILLATIVTASPARTMGTSTVIYKLQELRHGIQILPDNAFTNPETAEQHRKSLINKINAVINQIEAGAYEGALNKLEEDLEEKVYDWLNKPWEEYVNKKLRDIVELLEEMLRKQYPDFSISASPNSLKIQQGSYNKSTITITSLKSFSEKVHLTVTSSSIDGVEISLYPSEVIPSRGGFAISMLTVYVATTTVPGNYTITVTGTSGKCHNRQHSIQIELEIIPLLPPLAEFSLSARPQLMEVHLGGSNTSVIMVTSLKGFDRLVNLTAMMNELIAGVTVTLDPSQVIPPPNGYAISLLAVSANATAKEGSYAITLNGTSGSLQRSISIPLKIIAPPILSHPDFLIAAFPGSLTVQPGESDTSTIVVISVRGFNQPVNLTVISEPITKDVSIAVDPSRVTPPQDGFVTAMLTVNVAKTASVGMHAMTVTATSGLLEPKSSVIRLEVTALPKDTIPPIIASVLRNPETPAYNESTTVTAFVYDEGGSGVKQVILNYSGGTGWTPVNMTFSDGLYKTNIPSFPFNTTVEYRVIALDNANNLALSNLYSYQVIDPYPPLLRIDRPAQGSYLSGTVNVTVFMKDQNNGGESGFGKAELSINNTVVKTWEPPAPSELATYYWNTTAFGPDGIYTIKLSVWDKAGNIVEKSLTVFVDNTPPSAVITTPTNGSYLRFSMLIKVTGSDSNFDKMEMRIDDKLVRTSVTSGSEILEWDTQKCVDGAHNIKLTVYDKAGNRKQALVNVTVDNTPPSLGTPSWAPKEPAANVDIQINVTAIEPVYGSGIQNVTLWFKNKTMEEWQLIPMTLKNGNWTATLSNQSDTVIKFFVEAFDRAGNRAETLQTYEIQVAGVTGWPLAWILAIIIIIAAAIGSAAYFIRRRRRAQKGVGPTPSVTPPSSPLPPPVTPAIKPTKKIAESYGMASFVVPTYNEENKISQRIADVFEMAAHHKGPSEIIIVDDGSDDNTYEMVSDAVKLNLKKHPRITAKVVRHSARLGKAEAIRTGRNKALGEIVTTINGNASTFMITI